MAEVPDQEEEQDGGDPQHQVMGDGAVADIAHRGDEPFQPVRGSGAEQGAGGKHRVNRGGDRAGNEDVVLPLTGRLDRSASSASIRRFSNALQHRPMGGIPVRQLLPRSTKYDCGCSKLHNRCQIQHRRQGSVRSAGSDRGDSARSAGAWAHG